MSTFNTVLYATYKKVDNPVDWDNVKPFDNYHWGCVYSLWSKSKKEWIKYQLGSRVNDKEYISYYSDIFNKAHSNMIKFYNCDNYWSDIDLYRNYDDCYIMVNVYEKSTTNKINQFKHMVNFSGAYAVPSITIKGCLYSGTNIGNESLNQFYDALQKYANDNNVDVKSKKHLYVGLKGNISSDKKSYDKNRDDWIPPMDQFVDGGPMTNDDGTW